VDRRLLKYEFEPMDLANMRQNGVRSLEVMRHGCRHEVILNVDQYPGDLLLREFGPRMVCTKCGMVGGSRAAELERARSIGPSSTCAAFGPPTDKEIPLALVVRPLDSRDHVERGHVPRAITPCAAKPFDGVWLVTEHKGGPTSASAQP
jgi:hypothetical protein